MSEFMPGVPAAGHLSRGYWHPGRADGCPKCEAAKPAPRVRFCQVCQREQVRRPAVWDAKTVHGPWADLCQEHADTHAVPDPRLRNRLDGKGRR